MKEKKNKQQNNHAPLIVGTGQGSLTKSETFCVECDRLCDGII